MAIKESSRRLVLKYEEQKTKLFDSKYMLDKKIGEGMHSSVYKCFLIEDTRKLTPFAVKITRDDDEEKKMANRNEYEITKNLSNLNLLKVRELFENDVSGEMHLVMQFVDGQEILDQIAEQPQEFYTELQAKCIFE
jgi:serine/threonine protein kinase